MCDPADIPLPITPARPRAVAENIAGADADGASETLVSNDSASEALCAALDEATSQLDSPSPSPQPQEGSDSLHSEASNSSVTALLVNAMSDSDSQFWKHWWKKLHSRIPVLLKFNVYGKGRRRKQFIQLDNGRSKIPKLENPEDVLCEKLFNLDIDSSVKSAPVLKKVITVEEISQQIRNLWICDCSEEFCLSCTVQGLARLVDVWDENGSTVNNLVASNTGEMVVLEGDDKSHPENSHCEAQTTPENASGRCHAPCLVLANGTTIKLGATIQIGRFKVTALIEICDVTQPQDQATTATAATASSMAPPVSKTSTNSNTCVKGFFHVETKATNAHFNSET